MARKVAFAGGVLASVGVILGVWFQQWTFEVPTNPIGQAMRVSQLLVTHLSAVFMLTGAVVMALSILIAGTGYLPVRGHPTLLLWSGLGLTLTSLIIDIGVGSVLMNEGLAPMMLAGLNIALTIRWVGGTLMGFWLTGLLTERAASRVPGYDDLAAKGRARAV